MPSKYIRKFLGMIILHLVMTSIVHFLYVKKWVFSNDNQKKKKATKPSIQTIVFVLKFIP
jgi:hypothetical protein